MFKKKGAELSLMYGTCTKVCRLACKKYTGKHGWGGAPNPFK